MRYNLTDISRIPLNGPDLALLASDASWQARDPDAKISDCPWNTTYGSDQRYRRIVWRTTFRVMRELHTARAS